MQRAFKDSELYEARFGLKEQRSTFFTLLALMLFILFIFGFRVFWTDTFSGVEVDGASMYKTLHDGEELLMKYYKKGDTLERGDVIVVYVADYPEVKAYNANKPKERQLVYLIKRLIATEGDQVKCVNGQVYIRYKGGTDFLPLNEPYAYYTDRMNYDFDTYTVGANEIFFLGDNRNNSCDSRYGETGGSHLSGGLYKVDDVFGVVPDWAIENQSILQKIFF